MEPHRSLLADLLPEQDEGRGDADVLGPRGMGVGETGAFGVAPPPSPFLTVSLARIRFSKTGPKATSRSG